MFERETRIETLYAVRYYEDGFDKMLLQGKRGVKLYHSYNRAVKALSNLGQSGEVVKMSLNEVSYAVPIETPNEMSVAHTLKTLGELILAKPTRYYKADLITCHETNVIHHTPLGEKPVRQQGDTSTVLDLHIQVRIDN